MHKLAGGDLEDVTPDDRAGQVEEVPLQRVGGVLVHLDGHRDLVARLLDPEVQPASPREQRDRYAA